METSEPTKRMRRSKTASRKSSGGPSGQDLVETSRREPSTKELDLLDDMNSVVTEMAALSAVFETLRGEGSRERALSLCRETSSTKGTPRNVEELVTWAALCKILGNSFQHSLPTKVESSSWRDFVFETIASAWVSLTVSGRRVDGLMSSLMKLRPSFEESQEGGIELLALGEWGKAVEATSSGDLVSAKRCFEHAIDVGSQVGADSNHTINWSYAASFFR